MTREKKIIELAEEYLDKASGGVSEEVLSMIQERINGASLSSSGLSSVNFEKGKWVKLANDFDEKNALVIELLELNGDKVKVTLWHKIYDDFSGETSIFPIRNLSFPSILLNEVREVEKPDWVTE